MRKLLLLLLLTACAPVMTVDVPKEYPEHPEKLTTEEWKKRLTEEEFDILWKGGTERAFSGDLEKNKRNGTYVSAGCGIPVFHSKDKFDSGTGWPSFTEPLDEKNIILRPDNKFGMKRTEVLSKCGEHLGHVFDDGPPPTGKRFCINSAALDFIEE